MGEALPLSPPGGLSAINGFWNQRPAVATDDRVAYERWLNTQDTVAAAPRALNALQGKHVLLVDDVITTGSTIIRCAEALSTIPGIKQSVFTLAKAHHD